MGNLQRMISGITLILGLRASMSEPYFLVVLGGALDSESRVGSDLQLSCGLHFVAHGT